MPGQTKDARVPRPGKRYVYMVHASCQGYVTAKADYTFSQATGEPFDLKSVIFKSARLLPCLKVIEVKLEWPNDAKSTQ